MPVNLPDDFFFHRPNGAMIGLTTPNSGAAWSGCAAFWIQPTGKQDGCPYYAVINLRPLVRSQISELGRRIPTLRAVPTTTHPMPSHAKSRHRTSVLRASVA